MQWSQLQNLPCFFNAVLLWTCQIFHWHVAFALFSVHLSVTVTCTPSTTVAINISLSTQIWRNFVYPLIIHFNGGTGTERLSGIERKHAAVVKIACYIKPCPPFLPLHPFPTQAPSPGGFPQTPPSWSACHPRENQSDVLVQRSQDPLWAAGAPCYFSSSGCVAASWQSYCLQTWRTVAGCCLASWCGMLVHNLPAAGHQQSMVRAHDAGVSHPLHRDFSVAWEKMRKGELIRAC